MKRAFIMKQISFLFLKGLRTLRIYIYAFVGVIRSKREKTANLLDYENFKEVLCATWSRRCNRSLNLWFAVKCKTFKMKINKRHKSWIRSMNIVACSVDLRRLLRDRHHPETLEDKLWQTLVLSLGGLHIMPLVIFFLWATKMYR